MKIKADLHNHLRTSSILKEMDFNNSIEVASKKLGKGACFGLINMHDMRYEKFCNLKGYEREWVGENKNAVYVPEKDVLIVKGQEVTTKQGHLLVLGLKKDLHLKNGCSLEDTLKKSKDNAGISILDHPFYLEGTGDYIHKNQHLLKYVDAIEVFNGEAGLGFSLGPFPRKANEKAEKFYKSVKPFFRHLGAVSFSDGHSINEIGRCYTDMDFIEKKNFLSSLQRAVRRAELGDCKTAGSSFFNPAKHLAELAGIVFAEKFGYQGFKTERPDELGLSI